MGKGRYSATPVISNRYYASWKLPVRSKGYVERDFTKGIATVQYVIKAGDRADHLAAKFWGDESYWWVLCLTNNISYPFSSGGFTVGRVLTVAVNVKDVLDQMFQ